MDEITLNIEKINERRRELKWITEDGIHFSFSEMGTGYLFSVAIDLWHQFMPKRFWLINYTNESLMHIKLTLYETETYLKLILPELLNREDMSTYHRHVVTVMNNIIQE